MQVTVKGSGSYASICRFVDRLAKLKRLSKVNDLTVSAEGNADEYPMTATLVIYFGLQGKGLESGKDVPSPSGDKSAASGGTRAVRIGGTAARDLRTAGQQTEEGCRG